MKIDEAVILKLEKLSRLKLSTEERNGLKGDLESVLEMVNKLGEIDTEGVEPLTHIVGHNDNAMREDIVANQLSVEEALMNAPEAQPPYFIVPKVIKRT